MSQGVYVLGGKCPGGKCPGGKCPGGIQGRRKGRVGGVGRPPLFRSKFYTFPI